MLSVGQVFSVGVTVGPQCFTFSSLFSISGDISSSTVSGCSGSGSKYFLGATSAGFVISLVRYILGAIIASFGASGVGTTFYQTSTRDLSFLRLVTGPLTSLGVKRPVVRDNVLCFRAGFFAVYDY